MNNNLSDLPAPAAREHSVFETNPDAINDAKCEINRLIWQYSPPDLTLGKADELACKILCSIPSGTW